MQNLLNCLIIYFYIYLLKIKVYIIENVISIYKKKKNIYEKK